MPDTLTAFHPIPGQSVAPPAPLLSGAQMRDLWTAYEAARDGYSEEDEERTGAAFAAAQDRILQARTVDPEGIAIKVKLLDQRGDCPKGLLPDVFKDVLQPQGAPGTQAQRRANSRLRPLWQAYQGAWKEVCKAADAEDAAMLARPDDAPRASTQAEKDAAHRMKCAKQAYEAATEALVAAPTRTFDDALCRIEHAIDLADENTDADLINSLNKALRVLRKAYAATAN